ncbi:MAG: adenosylcobinamide-GDP ribazoletransferase [Paracoccaceae bacterium]
MERDSLRRLGDHLLSALALLTRLPLPGHRPAGANAAWVWPLVGAGLGALAAGLGSALLAYEVGPGVTAAITLAFLALMTGAIHEDGLADTADGLLGGRTPERRLEIMKDSRIGSFGALALMLVTLVAWSALAGLMAWSGHIGPLIAASALSRAPMAAIMASLPPARDTGLSAGTGRPSATVATLAALIGLLVAILALRGAAIGPILAAVALPALLALAARRLIGGQTGDILGASQQLVFAAALALAI